jgi:transposase
MDEHAFSMWGVPQCDTVCFEDLSEHIHPADRDRIRTAFAAIRQLGLVSDQVLENDRLVRASTNSTELGHRLMEVPGVGPVLASPMVATVPNPTAFKSGKDLAAWIGLYRGRTPVGARKSWAASPSRATATCGSCWWLAPWLSSDMLKGTAPSAPGWYIC